MTARVVENLRYRPDGSSNQPSFCLVLGRVKPKAVPELHFLTIHCEQPQRPMSHHSANGALVEGRRSTHKKARRWVVVRTHSWLTRFRRLLVRWEKREDTYLAMLHLALGIITWFHALLPK